MRNCTLILILGMLVSALKAQQQDQISIAGKLYPYIVDECGDTLIVANLENVSVSSMRSFSSEEDYNKYRKYRRAATIVYPYAVEAIKVFRELEANTEEMRKGKRKKYAKHLQKDLKEKFEDPLKKLTRTQGFVLTKMIEKELNVSTFALIKDLRGGFTASYWGTVGRFYGYRLKEAYQRGKDPILDIVLDDFNVSHKVQK